MLTAARSTIGKSVWHLTGHRYGADAMRLQGYSAHAHPGVWQAMLPQMQTPDSSTHMCHLAQWRQPCRCKCDVDVNALEPAKALSLNPTHWSLIHCCAGVYLVVGRHPQLQMQRAFSPVRLASKPARMQAVQQGRQQLHGSRLEAPRQCRLAAAEVCQVQDHRGHQQVQVFRLQPTLSSVMFAAHCQETSSEHLSS